MRHPTPIVALSLLLAALGLLWGSAGGGAASLPGGWEQVGTNSATPTQPALNGIVLALNTDQPGVMYAGGNFTDAGGDPNADYIARWDGTTWKALGAPKLNAQVTAIAYRNGKVYAGGTFTAAGGDTNAGFAAVWDGTKWSPVCKPSGPGGNVYALQISGSTIYIGGAFQRGAGIANANYLLACDLNTGAARLRGAAGLPAVFKLLRGTDNRKPIVELRLTAGDFSVCPKRKRSSATRLVATTVRQLWGNGKGSFRTRGRYATATVRGTNWLTADRCDGTQVRVVQGVIQVSDLPRRTQVTVRAGRSYLAKP